MRKRSGIAIASQVTEFCKEKNPTDKRLDLAGETRFEHATYGFGDRYSTVEPLPYALHLILYTKK